MTPLRYMFKMFNNISSNSVSSSQKAVLSVLIPSWNNLPYLKHCVESLRVNSKLDIEIIILLNEGRDGSLEWVKEQKDLSYVHSPTNLGICYGLNLCRPLVRSEYIVYMNDDMYAMPGWDQQLMASAKEIGHDAFMLSATMIEPHDTGNPCVVLANFGTELESFDEAGLLKAQQTLERSDWNGSSWPPSMISTKYWDMVGGYSIEYSPGMYSDPDLAMKLYRSGVRHFKGVGSSLVYHFGSKSTKRVKQNTGRYQFLFKWGMSSSFFYKKILRMGQAYAPLELDRPLTWSEKILNKLKVLKALFNS